jgi:hypothetical protein
MMDMTKLFLDIFLNIMNIIGFSIIIGIIGLIIVISYLIVLKYTSSNSSENSM